MCEGLWEGLGEECVSALRGREEERRERVQRCILLLHCRELLTVSRAESGLVPHHLKKSENMTGGRMEDN